ncbi:uracil-DNA glycosylase [Metasolibacillus meyeri]|uniref:uracil-DNA glycosylase n=1 Tax=Metasolibacillus meyeri TaxID=1071052 RepID=UPI000D31EB93|nr:uracil-DNA glycosylase [Metasolibacillus meyeri]
MAVNCFKCRYFRVTWELANPRACTAYGFKTKQIPSTVVRQSSGMECLKYAPKQEGKR